MIKLPKSYSGVDVNSRGERTAFHVRRCVAERLRSRGVDRRWYFADGDFGSRSNENLDELQRYIDKHGKSYPLMCMEFWDGWFNRWKEPVIRRDAQDLADCTKELLERASINFYMFQGGTNFGFWNGCSARLDTDLPQVTSYDYDAPVHEWGEPSEKFYLLQKVLGQYLMPARLSIRFCQISLLTHRLQCKMKCRCLVL